MKVETNRFYLRPLESADVSDRYLSWLNDSVLKELILETKQNIHDLKEYVCKQGSDPTVIFLGIFAKDSGTHLGNLKFHMIDRDASTACMGILIGDPTWRGRRVACEVITRCAEWLWINEGISEIHLSVRKSNKAAIAAYGKAGFKKEFSTVIQLDTSQKVTMILKMN